MNSESAQVIKEITPAALIGGGTISGGIWINSMPQILGYCATLAGTVLSIMLAWKAYNDIQNNKRLRKAEIADMKYRADNNLPCRRCSDK